MNQFSTKYDYLKEMAQKNYQSGCKKIDNYMIDENETNEFDFYFAEDFFKVPDLFISINGFEYNPGLLRNEYHEEYLLFDVSEVSKGGFKFRVDSSDAYFEKTHLDKITLCYFAFLKYQENQV